MEKLSKSRVSKSADSERFSLHVEVNEKPETDSVYVVFVCVCMLKVICSQTV